MKRYISKGNEITAVQIALVTQGIDYKKWGGDQHAKQNDWLVNNDGEAYTIDDAEFRRTYRETTPGRYKKHVEVWAEQAGEDGEVTTLEGATAYKKGDYLIASVDRMSFSYAISAEKFPKLYDEVL